jgi:hypothetical protein
MKNVSLEMLKAEMLDAVQADPRSHLGAAAGEDDLAS